MNYRRIQLSIIAFTLVLGGLIFTFSALAHTSLPAFASGISQDFYVPSGTDPWGTAIDSTGHIWVALPGCDPAPTCPSTTPPGKIAEFNPSNSSWMNTYTLPTGYAQPLFLAVDGQGHVWFTEPMNDSIGMLNPNNTTNQFQQWTIPT